MWVVITPVLAGTSVYSSIVCIHSAFFMNSGSASCIIRYHSQNFIYLLVSSSFKAFNNVSVKSFKWMVHSIFWRLHCDTTSLLEILLVGFEELWTELV